MLIAGSSQTEQRRECLLFESERRRKGARERRSVTVLCCGKQQPGGAELKTQTVFRGILFLRATFVPEKGKKDQWPFLLHPLHTTVFHLSPTRSQNQNI